MSGGPAWRRLARLARPRASRGQAIVALLCAGLGVALVTSVHTNRTPQALATARQEDLVRVLDALSSQSDRLRQQIDQLRTARDQLASSGDATRAAIGEARREADALAILAGSAPATGPGVALSIDDPRATLTADTMLDTVEELRDAGAEAIEIGPAGHAVRVVASTYFTDAAPGTVAVDGVALHPPYRIIAIGDPATLAAAMRIPGGVVDAVQRLGGSVDVETLGTVQVTALRPLDDPRYARPAPGSTGSAGS
ncbi:MAG: DUF881 domain-containing protein [Frankiaceae bacterium]